MQYNILHFDDKGCNLSATHRAQQRARAQRAVQRPATGVAARGGGRGRSPFALGRGLGGGDAERGSQRGRPVEVQWNVT